MAPLAETLRRAAAIAAGIACAAVPIALDRMVPGGGAARLDEALFAATFDGPGARPVRLPHRWHAECATCTTVWYRFDIPLQRAPREAQLIYLPAIGHNAAVYLNGRLLGQSGPFTSPVARNDDRPFVADAPAALWNDGSNRLYVLVRADAPEHGFMPVVHLGAEDAVAPVYRARALLHVTVRQVIAAGVSMLGLVMLVLWTYRRSASAYGWLAAAALVWGVHVFANLAAVPLLQAPWWDGVLGVTFGAAAAAALVLARRLTWAAPQPAELALLAVPVASFFLAAFGFLELAGALGLALFLAAAAVLCAAGWRARTAARWLLVPGIALVALAVHDLLGAAGAWGAAQVDLLSFAAPVLVGAAAWALLARFVDTLNAAELLNVDLEDMVEQKRRELQTQFERVRELERTQAIASERERLMRDMHDGLGGHLVSLLASIESGRSTAPELAATVRGALDDMRLMIDSLDPVDGDLNAVLAMYRDRLAPRLRTAGVDLQWDVGLLPPIPGLTPARVLHVLRLLQEAVTNAVKHGKASSIAVSAATGTRAEQAVVQITVADNGAGFDVARARPGRGLTNMRRRAEEAGGALTIASAPDAGTRVSLALNTAPPSNCA